MKYINYNKIYANIKKINENKNLMIVLKDDAYNFGLKNVCVICLSLGIKDFAVKNIKEALYVRSLSKNADILILGKLPLRVDLIKRHNLLVTVSTKEELRRCLENNIDYHLEFRTSMNRFGVDYQDINEYLSKNLKGMYIHTPVDCKKENQETLEKLEYNAKKYNLNHLQIHIGGSGFLKIKSRYTYRIACDIYKGSISCHAKIIHIRKVKANEYIGYDHNFKAKNDCLVAICDVGYVNGLSRKNINSYVYINSKKYFFIGYKCMDLSFILVDDEVKVGDKVELLGDKISEEEFIKMNDLILHQMYLNIR